MKRLLLIFPVAFGFVFYSSCQKELNGTLMETQNPGCEIATAYYYQGASGIYDSSQFIYSGDKVIKAESDLKLVTYTYSGANISSRTYYDKIAKSVSFIDSTEYDVNNRMKKLTVWFFPGGFRQDTTRIIYIFSYKGSNIDDITTIQRNAVNVTLRDTLHNIFRTNTGGNVENIITVDNVGNLYDSVHYAYDNNPNYYRRIHPNYFLFDVNFQLLGSYLHHLPYFVSKNNVTEFSYYASGIYPITYELDSLGNLTSLNLSGSPYVTYKYNCK